jgi:hypothetical protein
VPEIDVRWAQPFPRTGCVLSRKLIVCTMWQAGQCPATGSNRPSRGAPALLFGVAPSAPPTFATAVGPALVMTFAGSLVPALPMLMPVRRMIVPAFLWVASLLVVATIARAQLDRQHEASALKRVNLT